VLNRLVPETGELIARAVADVFQSVPWTRVARPADDTDLASWGLTYTDAKIGSWAVQLCCPAYHLVYSCLHDLLRDSPQWPPEAQVTLLRDCARLIEDGLTDDFNAFRDPLEMLLNEDLDDQILDDLLAWTGFGERYAVGTASDESGRSWRVVRPVAGKPAAKDRTASGLLRPVPQWDVPAYVLDRVPGSAGYFARQFADAIRLAPASSGLIAGRDHALDVDDAIAGRKLAELAAPGSLVSRFLVPVIDLAGAGAAESEGLIRRCCSFLDTAIAVDARAGGQLARELTLRLSDTFISRAKEIAAPGEGALRRILNGRPLRACGQKVATLTGASSAAYLCRQFKVAMLVRFTVAVW
jgi:hypothetical protein